MLTVERRRAAGRGAPAGRDARCDSG